MAVHRGKESSDSYYESPHQNSSFQESPNEGPTVYAEFMDRKSKLPNGTGESEEPANTVLSVGAIKGLLAFTILFCACIVAFASRLFAVIRFESIIHEFDPW